MKFKIGDKVRLKGLDEILKNSDFQLDLAGNVVYKSDFIALLKHEIKYCGRELEVIDLYQKHYILTDCITKKTLGGVPPLILEPAKEIKLVDLKTAVEALKSGECDAIRFEHNKAVCAYLDNDGEFKKTTIVRIGALRALNYTDQSFFMHEVYLFDSRWELIVDEYKRKRKDKVNKLKKEIIDSLGNLYFTSQDFKLENYNQICDVINKIRH